MVKRDFHRKIPAGTLATGYALLHAKTALAAAGPIEYIPIQALPNLPTGVPISLNAYLNAMFTIGIGMAGVLAVLMIVIAGIEYMGGAASPSIRSDAKERISNALLGLLIAAISWIILFAINPKLLG